MRSSSATKFGLALGLFLAITPLLRADDNNPATPGNRVEVSERIGRLRLELTNDLNNHLITSDQFNAEVTRLDQLKIQEHADASQNNGNLTSDQQGMYNDLLSQIHRDIDQMIAANPQASTSTVAVPATIPWTDDTDNRARTTDKSGGQALGERFGRLRQELTNDLNNHLITPDQFNAETTKLNLLKVQEHADASQGLLKDQQSMYSDQLGQIQTEIDQMLEANSQPSPAQ